MKFLAKPFVSKDSKFIYLKGVPEIFLNDIDLFDAADANKDNHLTLEEKSDYLGQVEHLNEQTQTAMDTLQATVNQSLEPVSDILSGLPEYLHDHARGLAPGISFDHEGFRYENVGGQITKQNLSAPVVLVEPVAVEPVIVEPVIVEPVAAEPVAAEPVAAEPVAAEPVAAEPVAAEPVAAEPVAAEPVAAEPVAAEPVVAEPVAAEPVENVETSKATAQRIAERIIVESAESVGDGAQSIIREISKLLVVSPYAKDLAEGKLTLSFSITKERGPNFDHIEIVWKAQSLENDKIGQVTQANKVPKGKLDNAWGDDAVYAAEGARDGIMELLDGVAAQNEAVSATVVEPEPVALNLTPKPLAKPSPDELAVSAERPKSPTEKLQDFVKSDSRYDSLIVPDGFEKYIEQVYGANASVDDAQLQNDFTAKVENLYTTISNSLDLPGEVMNSGIWNIEPFSNYLEGIKAEMSKPKILNLSEFGAQNPSLRLNEIVKNPAQFKIEISPDGQQITIEANGRDIAEIDKQAINTMKSGKQDLSDRGPDAWKKVVQRVLMNYEQMNSNMERQNFAEIMNALPADTPAYNRALIAALIPHISVDPDADYDQNYVYSNKRRDGWCADIVSWALHTIADRAGHGELVTHENSTLKFTESMLENGALKERPKNSDLNPKDFKAGNVISFFYPAGTQNTQNHTTTLNKQLLKRGLNPNRGHTSVILNSEVKDGVLIVKTMDGGFQTGLKSNDYRGKKTSESTLAGVNTFEFDLATGQSLTRGFDGEIFGVIKPTAITGSSQIENFINTQEQQGDLFGLVPPPVFSAGYHSAQHNPEVSHFFYREGAIDSIQAALSPASASRSLSRATQYESTAGTSTYPSLLETGLSEKKD